MKITATFIILRSYISPSVGAFSPANIILENIRTQSQFALLPEHRETTTSLHQSEIIDAEVVPDESSRSDSSSRNGLIEYSQNQDPEWKSMPIAFCDNESNSYIDCNLAFYVKDPLGDISGYAEYALGVPSEIPIVVAFEPKEDKDRGANANASDAQRGEENATVINLSKVIPISPDTNQEGSIIREDEKEEIFQIAARALKNGFGPSIRLKKTPRTLTVEGDLDTALGDWRKVLLGKKADAKEKLSFEDAVAMVDEEDDDDEDDFFDKIMKRDLGPDYMNLVDDDDEIDEDFLQLFDTAGLDENLSELAENIIAKEKNISNMSYDQLVQQLQPSAALKLLNFLGPGGREYVVLRPLRPILLIGKEDPDDYTRRILLTEEERKAILPRLETACREGLENLGFFLAGSGI